MKTRSVILKERPQGVPKSTDFEVVETPPVSYTHLTLPTILLV